MEDIAEHWVPYWDLRENIEVYNARVKDLVSSGKPSFPIFVYGDNRAITGAATKRTELPFDLLGVTQDSGVTFLRFSQKTVSTLKKVNQGNNTWLVPLGPDFHVFVDCYGHNVNLINSDHPYITWISELIDKNPIDVDCELLSRAWVAICDANNAKDIESIIESWRNIPDLVSGYRPPSRISGSKVLLNGSDVYVDGPMRVGLKF